MYRPCGSFPALPGISALTDMNVPKFIYYKNIHNHDLMCDLGLLNGFYFIIYSHILVIDFLCYDYLHISISNLSCVRPEKGIRFPGIGVTEMAVSCQVDVRN